jgi:hypothetical protein
MIGNALSRRGFLAASTAGFPAVVPTRVFGKSAPSNLIQVAQIGCGRIARGSEFPGIFRHSGMARFVAPPDSGTIDHAAMLMDPSRRLVYVTALNTARQSLLGYIFRREEYPWLQDWESYETSARMNRGLEFSTQPFDIPRREAIDLHSMFGAPTYRWLPAKSKIGSRFLLFWAKAPAGMSKVDDVRLENGRIVIEDRAAQKRIELPASQPL